MGARVVIANIPARALSLYERSGWTVLPPERGYAWQAPDGLLLAEYAAGGPPFVHLAYKQLGTLAYSFTFDHINAPPIGRASAALMMGNYEGNVDESKLSVLARQQLAVVAGEIEKSR